MSDPSSLIGMRILPHGELIAFDFTRRDLAFYVEVTRLAEVEQALVELGPLDHASAMHVVRQMVDVRQSVADRVLLGAGNGFEVDVINTDIADAARLRAVLAAPPVDEVDQRIADSLDRGNVQLHRAGFIVEAPRAEIERAFVRLACIGDAERDRADRRAVQTREPLREGIRLGVDQEVDLALPVQRHLLVTMTGNRGETHLLEQLPERHGIGRGVFDEFKTIRANGIVPSRGLHALSPEP